MHFYHAYGLGIHSELPISALQSQPDAPRDISIRVGIVESLRDQDTNQASGALFSDDETCFYWREAGKYAVRAGREIIVQPNAGANQEIVCFALTGTLLAVLLHQRGLFVLHASAVAIQGRAAIFLGEKGQGKSTMAAALYGRGHELVADDIVALSFAAASESPTDEVEAQPQPQMPMVQPGFPHFKLWPEAAASALGDDPHQLPRLFKGYEKRGRTVSERFTRESLPLARVYVLENGAAPSIEAMSPQDAMVHLITHSYGARYGRQLLQGAAGSRHFLDCAHLIQKVPPQWLKRHRDLGALADVAKMVEGDCAP